MSAAAGLAPTSSAPPVPLIGFGQVRHSRLRPALHSFAYPTFFLLLPMRQLAAAAQQNRSEKKSKLASTDLAKQLFFFNKPGWLSYRDEDHGDGRAPAAGGALAWLDGLLQQAGIADADGEVWLHCYPRVLGYAFKPVSFWYCHDRQGTLRAIVVEVNNTFGERHCYLLDRPRYGATLQAAKCFHVSPFCQVGGDYRFRFLRTRHQGSEHTVVRIDHHDDQGPLLNTSVSGRLQPFTPAAARAAVWRHPLLSLGVMARIHWQALLLWRKRVPFFSKPAPPPSMLSR